MSDLMKQTLDHVIGNNLRFLREEFGYSQAHVSELLNITQPAYQKYESGKTTVCQAALEKLAELYCVEEYDLMQDDQENLKPAIAFAFRGDADLEAISCFHRIVKNYVQMCHELKKKK